MSVNRKRSRKLLFQILYSKKYNNFNKDEFFTSFYNDKFTFEVDKKYIDEMLIIIEKNTTFFNITIKKYAPKFDLEQMAFTYIIPIYIALAEIFFYSEEIPLKVSINEAIELSKVYSDESGKKIVNGILNNVLENYEKLKKTL